MNNFCFTGNMGNDCRVNSVSGSAVCNFTVAVKSGFGDKEQTIWVDCAMWGKQAEGKLTEYLKKGQAVAVCGELGTREHEGKTYITCRTTSVSLVGGKSGNSQPQQAQQQQPQKPTQKAAQDLGFDEDLPF